MEWYWIVLITIGVMELITIVLALIDEDIALMFNAGIVYVITKIIFVVLIKFVFYPVRAIKTYNQCCGYYKKHGISKAQYFFGKRVHKKD